MRTFGGRSAALLWCACSFPCCRSLLCINCVRCLCQHLLAKVRRVVVDAGTESKDRKKERRILSFSLSIFNLAAGKMKNQLVCFPPDQLDRREWYTHFIRLFLWRYGQWNWSFYLLQNRGLKKKKKKFATKITDIFVHKKFDIFFHRIN